MDLIDLAPQVQRAVAPPGEFDTYFPETTEDDLAATLADGLAEAQLDGFLAGTRIDLENSSVDPALSAAQVALGVLYARSRVLTARLANIRSMTRYKAGPVETETQQAATVLVQLLKDSKERKSQLLLDARFGIGIQISMTDLYVTKSIDSGYASGHGLDFIGSAGLM